VRANDLSKGENEQSKKETKMKLKMMCLVVALLSFVGLAQAQIGGSATLVTTAPPYGSQGSVIPMVNLASVPLYESVNIVDGNEWFWAPTHTCWYNSDNIRFVVILLDGSTHRVSMFLQDFDNQGRSEKVFVTDSNGNQLTETTVTNFANGEYLSWNVSGAVVFNVTNDGGVNAVANGLFLDPASTGVVPPPTL
jgi:hypothetical protein